MVTVLALVVAATESVAQTDPVTVSFGSSMYSVSEGASVAVTVELSGPRNSDATVQITAAGSASALDYSLSDTSVMFAADETSKTVTVTALEDRLDDDSESVTLTLEPPSGLSTGTHGSTTAAIVDGDQAALVVEPADVSVREGSGEVDLDWLDDLDVVWDSPSADEFGSMPLGNGDIGLNVWVVDGGDLLFYISKTDTWNEFSSLFKLGRVRVKFDPNPFAGRASFEQALVLRNGEITIESTKTDNFGFDLKIWVDANNPVIRVEGTSSADMDVTVDLEMWRTERRELDQYITYDSNGRRTKHPDNYREPYEYWYEDDTTVVLEPDTVVSGLTDRIVWYHRNGYSKFDERLGELGQSYGGSDPLIHRTFGAAILGPGLTRNSSDQSLIRQDTTTVDISIFPLTMQPATVAEWRSGLDSSISAVESSSKSARYDAHKRWWQEFWGRHRISVSSDESPAERSSALAVSRAYALQRFMNAAAGRGAQPIKFNGSIFTVDVVNNLPAFFNTYRAGYFDPDFRAWGASHWYQNVRFPYLTMLMGGDYEFMQPFFDMYTGASSSWTSHVKGTYLHDGFVLPELMNSWGGGIATSNSINGLVEISAIMLDFYQFTQDQAFFDTVLLPFVNGVLTYYDQHWSRSSTGDIRIVSSALEQERGAVNPTSDLAGLHVVVDKMVALPDELTSEADRALWVRMKKDLPNIATFVRNGQEIVAIAERPHRSASRGENPDLYAVWPFRVYSVGKPDLDLAVATYNQRAATGVTGWQQDPAQAAMLGMTDEAKRHLLTYVTKEEPNRGNRDSFRFPGFYGPAQDWFPVQTQPSIAMSTLQNMLVQYEDHRILMFPAWPQEWDADFKVHLPYETTIEGVLKDGVVESLTVTPEHRDADIEFVQFDPDTPVVDNSTPVVLTTERVEAEDYKAQMGLQVESTTDGGVGQSIGFADVNDYLVYPARDFSDVGSVSLRVASNRGVTARAELRSGSTTGAVIASFEVFHTGGWQSFITVTEDIVDPGEQLDLYLVFTAWGFNLNWIEFTTDPSSGAGASNGDYDSDGDGLIEVSTLAQFDAIRWDLDGDGNSLNSGHAGAFSGAAANMGCPSGGCSGYELSAVLDFDTDASGSVDRLDGFWNSGLGWEPIGTYDRPFRAVFDGNGHEISNLFIDRTTDNVGLFGYVGDSALLVDVKLTGAAVTTSGRFAGALAGTSLGAIVSSSADGEVSATGYAGVLAGANRAGRIQASHAAGEVAAYGYVGGLVGLNSGGAVEASYSTARVLQRSAPDNRATAQIGNDGAGHTGGLIGKTLDSATVTDSYWDTQTSTQATSDGGTAKTTTELASPTGYSGIYQNWNVDSDLDNTDDDPWNFGTASDLPTLKHATVPATPLTATFPTGPYTVTEGATIKIELELSKDPDATFTVPLTVTAQDGATANDYTVTPTSVVLNDGETFKTITLTATDDTVIEERESVLLGLGTLPPGLSAGPRNTITVSIVDDDTPTWSVTAEPARVVEGVVSTVTVSVDKAFDTDQTITLAVGGTAASGDYSLSSSSLTLEAGDTSVTASVTAVADSDEESDETVVVTASHGGKTVGSATVTIADSDTAVWSVTAEPARVVEGVVSTVTVSVDKAFDTDQTITLAVGGTAAGTDYTLSSSSLTLEAGDTSVTASVTAVADSDEESDETVVVTASHGGKTVGSATVTIEANDTPVSSDAALSSLALSGVGIGGFDAGVTGYAVSVGYGVSSTVVTAVARDGGASVVIAGGGGETQGTSRSVSLVVGDNEITVTVTAEDAATTKTYTVTVTRGEPDVAPLPPGVVWGDRLADRDIALPGVSSPSGVWFDGTDVSVVTTAGRISVYSLADGAEHTDRGFTLPGGAEYAAGLWSNGATLWVADVNRGWVRAYRLSDGARQADRDLDTTALAAAGNTEPAGIWSNGTTMWVADFTDSSVYAYDLASKARVADKELDLDKNPGETYNPFGIWSNGDTLLAASWFGGEIIAHSLTGGQRQPAKDLATFASRTNFPNGIWSNGHILWVVDASAATLYAYAVPGLGAPDTASWSVVADPATVAEGQASTVTVSVDKTFDAPQTIALAATGGTAAGTDYTLSPSVTLDAGDTAVTASVTAVDDSVFEGDETVVVTASHDASAVGSVTVTIAANDTPTWSVVADPATVAEGQASTVTVSVDKTFETAQTIALAATGTAAGTDYTLSPSVTLNAGDTAVTASVTAVDDSVFEGDETVVVTASHDASAVGSATVTIEANDTPTWSVTADPATVAEGQTSTVTVSVDKTFETAQTIALAATGTAAGTDYTLSPSVTLDAGDSEVSVSVTAVDDSVIEGGAETVVVTASHDASAVGSVTVTIEDNDTPTWSLVAEPATVAEGQASTVTVSVDKTFETAQTIALAATGGTAAGTDYTLSSSSVTLAAGDTAVTAVVTAVDDNDEENDETVVVTASHDSNAVGSVTVTIAANDTPTWSLVADPATVAEGQASTVTVSVDKTFETAQTIALAATGGTAAGTDYTLPSSSVTLAAGASEVSVSVTAVDDSVFEGDETVVVTASHDASAVGSVTVTIAANDTPTWSVVADPATVAEGQASTVTVSVDKTFETAQTIALAATGTAAGTDYTLSPSVTLDAGDSEVSVSVTAVDDSVFEGDETVVVTASHDSSAVGSATFTIEANDTPTWSVVADPATVAEGQASTVTVSVDKTFETAQTIALAATGGTAAGTDYTLSPSVTLNAGDTAVTASVTAVDDGVIEGGDETVVVTASHGDGSVGSATITIEDNDTLTWSVTAEPATVAEGQASTVTVSVDKTFETAQTIALAATGGTAAGTDYTLSSSSVTLAAGAKTATAVVTAVDDNDEETDETVVVTASHDSSAVGSVTVTIAANDTPTWSLVADPATVAEGQASTVTVSVDKTFETAQTIALAATGGTAAGTDYTLSPSVRLAAGDSEVSVSVTAVDDSVFEGDETVVVTASHDASAVGSVTVTIAANDTPTWSVVADPATVAEGQASTVTVSVDKTFETAQTIALAATGTAAGTDYTLSPSVRLAAGDSEVSVSVTAVDDSVFEGDETVVVTASHDASAVGSVTVTIAANDTPTWSVVADPATVAEGQASTVTVSVDKTFDAPQTIALAATGGTAAGTDYTLSPSVTLAAGDTSVTASVTAVADGVIEGGDETVVVTASHGDGSVGSATITIEDNDTPTWSVTAEPATVAEGQASTVTVSVDKTFETAQTISLAATGGTAAGTDYTLSPSSLTLDAGAKTATASVTAVDDNDEESDETVVVTASHDSSAVGSVTITIEAVAPLPPGVVWGDRLPDRDIALPGAPTGVWSNGTDVWVLTTAGRISVYSLADGAEHTDRGFTLPGGAEYAAGLWSNGATLWVSDVNRGWVRAYRLSDGARQADRDLDTAALAAAGNTEPAGIWSNGTTMWVADFTDSRVYAYDLTTKARVADKELDLDKNPGEAYNPFGIWSNGDTLLAASWLGGEIIAHSLTDGQRQPAKDLSTFASRTNFPNDIWSNGHILWVVDASAATLYAYAVPGLGAPPNDTPGSGN